MRSLHPLHAILLAFPLPLFLGALLSDYAYWSSYHVQWINFSSWLIAGGVLMGTFVLLWALIVRIRMRLVRTGRASAYLGLLLVMWILAFINALIHAKDAWASMPQGLFLSIVVTALALAAAWIGYSGLHGEDAK